MERAGTGLEKIVVSALRRVDASQGAVLAWPVACGSAVASRTTALQFCEGVLRVEVPDAGWRKELQALAPRYVAVLNRYVSETVRRIEFVIAGQQGTNGSWRTAVGGQECPPHINTPQQNPISKR